VYYYFCGIAGKIRDSASPQYKEAIESWTVEVRNGIYPNSMYTYGTTQVIEEFFLVALDVFNDSKER